MLNIRLQKESTVSIHQQLVTQISLQIASGALPTGTKLPSVRSLSQRLSIHYNTCMAVYKELNEIGMVESRKGSGVFVCEFTAEQQTQPGFQRQELAQMARYFVNTILQMGYHWPDVLQTLEIARKQWLCEKEQIDQAPLALLDMYQDILPVFRYELETVLNRPVKTVYLPEFVPAKYPPETRYLVSRYHYKMAMEYLPPDAPILLIDISTNPAETALVKKFSEDALVLVISYSVVILQMAESVIKSIRGDSVHVKTIQITDETTSKSKDFSTSLRHADFIYTDTLSALLLSPEATRKSAVIKIIPPEEMDKIKAFIA
ncbi:MAG: GntR family transcriptional regulator [Cyanobacteria bacterium]|nr:GntR family transcriptional regulator [Cyanobacteriota bacterium]